MKNFIKVLMLLITLLAGVLGYNDASEMFVTFASLIGATWGLTELIKRIPKFPDWAIQIASWLTGLALSFSGWLLALGFLAGLLWWEAMLWGLGASMVANAVADAETVQTLIRLITSIFKRKK